ncbi:MAG: hypothetical protein OES09_13000 [Gammaproteobacteria bacterium]|nr:hypothetical protein [Gammaproteobacteria bacterium]
MHCYEQLVLRRSLRTDALTLFPDITTGDLALDAALCDFDIEGFEDYLSLSKEARHRLAWHACELMSNGAGPDLGRAA